MAEADGGWIRAGVVGSPHGLDGSFHVREPRASALVLDARVRIRDRDWQIARRAGTDSRPIVRVEGCEDRDAAASLRGEPILVGREQVPPLGPDEWWAEDLTGCVVRDGDQTVGKVRRLLALPSCEVLEVVRADGRDDLLVPLVRDAVRAVDIDRGEIDIDLRFLGEAPT